MWRNWTRKRKVLTVLSAILSLLTVSVLSLLFLMEHLTETVGKVPDWEQKNGTLVFYDRMGVPVHHIRNAADDYCYFFPISIDDLPQQLLDVTVAAEDHRFYEHDGVDGTAMCRAAWQLIWNRRIVSGASTITMQLMSMRRSRASGRHTFREKIQQVFQAKYYERHHTKRRILEQYLNALPYGGKIYGIEAAALYYFSRHAKDLNLAETILLSGLPQAPSKLRPDKYPERAKKRFLLIVDALEKQEYFSHEQAEEIRGMELRYRDFSVPFLPTAQDPQYFQHIVNAEKITDCHIHTQYDARLTAYATQTLKNALPADGSVQDAVMIVVENKTGTVPVMIGTLNYNHANAGQVNAATAFLSPGSLYKPFLYGEAMDGGLIVPQTILDDTPFVTPDYRPENFSGTFHGKVSATVALANSYNIPAIHILQDLGVDRMLRKFVDMGLVQPPQKDPGLTLALGSVPTTPLNLARAYSALYTNRLPEKLTFLQKNDGKTPMRDLWTCQSVGQAVLEMLRTNALPYAQHLNIAWKTGTSNGFHDAWCIAVSPQYTVVVWFGNKSGKASPHLVGIKLAAPMAGKMMSALHQPPIQWKQIQNAVKTDLCTETGLRKSTFCKQTMTGTAFQGVPLKICEKCREESIPEEKMRKTIVSSPASGTYRPVDGTADFILQCTPANVHAFLDGSYVGIQTSGQKISLPPGTHTLVFLGDGNFTPATEVIRVIPDKK